MGHVLHTTETVESNPAYTMSYQYNLAGALTSETYPSSKTYATSYDIAGRIAGVTGPNSKVYADSFTYAPHGGVAQMRLGNQLWEHASFNTRLQPTEIGIGTAQSGTASVDRLKLTYDYGTTDNNGNVKSQTITVPTIGSVTGTTLTQCYTYDGFNRLKTAEEHSGTTCQGTTDWTQKYMYDQQGNRRFDTGTTIPVGFPNPTINTANNNRIDTGQGYVYDLAGNVTQDLSHAYTFDAEERQTKVDNGATGTYSYDGRGQRLKSITSAGTTIYVYDAMGRLVAEYTSGNATGSGTSYVTADALGSPRVITAQDKSVKARHDYLPFGEEIPAGYGSRTASQGYIADNLRQKFTGKERDIESGLDYFGSRYYASALGRFNSPDSVSGLKSNPQSLNLYCYALDNPLKYIDPTGHEPSDTTDDKLQEDAHKNRKIVMVEVDDNNTGKPWNKNDKVIDEVVNVKAPSTEVQDLRYGEYLEKYGNWIQTHSRADGMVLNPTQGVLGRVFSPDYIDPSDFTFEDYLDLQFEQGMQMCMVGICGGTVPVGGGSGARSFNAFKRLFGRAGAGSHWHHIVEQTPGNTARFGAEAVHNPGNMIKVNAEVHAKISGYYSSIQRSFTGGLTVRQWLSTQSFAEQAAFGNQVLKTFGVIR